MEEAEFELRRDGVAEVEEFLKTLRVCEYSGTRCSLRRSRNSAAGWTVIRR